MSVDITIPDRLEGDGWREMPDAFKNYGRSFFKRFPTKSPYRPESEKPGIQIQIVATSWKGKESHEAFLVGELSDGTWIELHQYALNDIEQTLALVIPRLLAVWESTATYPDDGAIK